MCLDPQSCGDRRHECTCSVNERHITGFHLRLASLVDVPALLALIGELASFEGLAHECQVSAPLLAKHLFGPDSAARAIIANHQGSPAGFAVWYPTFSTFLGRPGAFLEDLYVRPQYRKRGLGRQLFAAVARQAEGAGCARLEWRALKWNDAALKFYKSLGAEILSEWLTLRLDAPALFALPTSVNATASPSS